MSRINIGDLRIVGTAIIPAGVTATAPDGYSFVMLTPATGATVGFQHLFSPSTGTTGTNFVGSNAGATGPVGAAGQLVSTANLFARPERPIYGRYTQVRPDSSFAVFAYIGK